MSCVLRIFSLLCTVLCLPPHARTHTRTKLQVLYDYDSCKFTTLHFTCQVGDILECVVALRHYEWTKVRTNTLCDSDGECHDQGNVAIRKSVSGCALALMHLQLTIYVFTTHGCVAHVTTKLSLLGCLGCYVPARVQSPVHNLYRAHSMDKRFHTKCRGKTSV